MIRINLLPHREIKRAARQRQFAFLAGATAVLGAVAVFMGHGVLMSRIDHQNERNKFLENEIAKLDKEIAEIKKLKEQTQALLARKRVVESLQGNRSQAVVLIDQLVRLLPEGVYLKSVKQTGATILIAGYTQSNARVSTLMRNLDESPYLESPVLIEIKAGPANAQQRTSEFSLRITLTPTQSAEEPKAKKG